MLVSDEVGPAIREYDARDGRLVRSLNLPPIYRSARKNLSLESLAYDPDDHTLWTANEETLAEDGATSNFAAGSVIRVQRFDSERQPNGQWAYVTDALAGDMLKPGRDIESNGVSDLVALPGGGLHRARARLRVGRAAHPPLRDRLRRRDRHHVAAEPHRCVLQPAAQTAPVAAVVPEHQLRGRCARTGGRGWRAQPDPDLRRRLPAAAGVVCADAATGAVTSAVHRPAAAGRACHAPPRRAIAAQLTEVDAMAANAPRVAPLEPDEWDDEVREILQASQMGGRVLNIFATLARHPKLLKRWLVFGNHVLFKSTLSPRERELLILRTGWNCRAEYEWGQHVVIGKQVGISDDEIERITRGTRCAGMDAARGAVAARRRRAASRQPHRRRDLVGVEPALRHAAADRRGVHRRPVHAGVDGAEQLRRAVRRGDRRIPRAARLI